jgi:ADP-ribosyl-[dinitrogen reductase] hydrolase
LSHKQIQAGIGALIGSAVADALGAPFEFKPAEMYKERFPKPILGGIGELVGGGGFGWGPGEFTDDTQMALALAEALLGEATEFDAEVVWRHFVAWASSATDIGNTTVQSLSHPDYRVASQVAHEVLGGSGSNGSVMRTAPLGLLGVQWGQEKTIRIARAQSQGIERRASDIAK